VSSALPPTQTTQAFAFAVVMSGTSMMVVLPAFTEVVSATSNGVVWSTFRKAEAP